MATNNDMSRKRAQAKAGMALALGALVGTSLLRHAGGRDVSRLTRTLHVAAGVALVGFSCWHQSLYKGKQTDGR